MPRYERLSPMQAATLEIPEEYNVALLGGRGGGKTTTALLLATDHVRRYGELADALYTRKTYGALGDLEDEYRLLLNQLTGGAYDYNRAERRARLLGGRTQLVAVDDAKSYERVQGSNRTLLVVDEVTQHKSERFLRRLRSNLRAPEGVKTRTVYVGNPGGPLHGLIFDRHVRDRVPFVPYEIDLGDGAAETWVTVPSTITDNPFVDTEAATRKLREACHGDPVLLRQWMYGDWEQGAGLMFAAWDDAVHVLNIPPDYRPDRDNWRTMTSTDWGLSAPSVSLLGLIARRRVVLPGDRIAPRGSILVLDEVTDALMDDPEDLSRSREWTPGRLAERILGRVSDYGLRHTEGVVDDARGLQGESLKDEMKAEGMLGLRRPRKGRRAEGYAILNSMIQAAADSDPVRPHIYVSDRAKYLLATLPRAVRDERDPDDVADTPNCPDHAIDALRYLVGEARRTQASGNARTTGMY